jgi:acyl carrier protein
MDRLQEFAFTGSSVTNNVVDRIIRWFQKNSNIEEDQLYQNLSSNYFELGWIDSFKFIEFISYLEREYEITFSNDEFQDRSFATISGLSAIIRKKIDAE